jgi:hypothetical protein
MSIGTTARRGRIRTASRPPRRHHPRLRQLHRRRRRRERRRGRTGPGGLRLDGKTGVISGKPLARGTFKITISVTDSAAPARESLTEQYSITIAK